MAKKDQTQLDIDIRNAIKMGMSYGRYMGLVKHPTKLERRKEKEQTEVRTCRNCGKDIAFAHGSARFCDAICREQYRRNQNRRPLQQKTCPICGKEFMGMKHEKYCGKNCSKIGHSRVVREYQMKKATEGV